MENQSGVVPLGRAVLVKPYQMEKVTQAGLVLPAAVTERGELQEQRGVVVEAGPVAWADEPFPRAKSGDRVLFSKFAGHAITGPLDGQKYRVVNDRDIFLRIEGEKE